MAEKPKSELDRSLDRVLDGEEYRTDATGFGTTKQAQALRRDYRQPLADRIAADRTYGYRNKDVWRALKDMDDATLAIRLLIAGMTVAEGKLGVDKNGEKNFRDQAVFIGRNLGQQQRRLAFEVGGWGIDMLQSLSVFDLDVGDVLRMTAPVDEIMDDVLLSALKNNPLLTPRTTPPEPWTQLRRGGLPADHWAKVPLIRERHPSIDNAVRYAISRGKMQPVLDAINVLQRTTFTINKPVLDFMLRHGEPPAPEGQPPPIWQKERRQKWNETRAKHGAFQLDMIIADAMAAAEHFWVPLNMDFRGRVYGLSHFNFQREDHIRALFLFADGEEIGEEGLKWLKAHVAGANGGEPRKLGHYKRIEWTEANLERLCDIGRAVLRCDDPATIAWDLPKDRYQFLAACVELTQAIDKGPTFKTRLPLMFDCSCSGLQHLSAMTRAKKEGLHVNLTDAFKPHDFYTLVANRVWDVAPDLRHLMQDQNDRDIMKQPTMSYFYGSRAGGFRRNTKDERLTLAIEKPRVFAATDLGALLNSEATDAQIAEWEGKPRAVGMVKQIIDFLEERGKNRIDGAEVKQFAQVIYDSIEELAPRAKQARYFLRRLAWLCAKEGKPLRWTTAGGLPVINCYHEPIVETIPARLHTRRRPRRVNLVVDNKPDVWKTKAANAAAANFVHSLDATHLQAIAIETAKAGIEIVVVHDCFGTIAPRAARLKEAIAVKFVQLHRRDLLAEVLESARDILPKDTKLPKLPEKGTLKLEGAYSNYHLSKN
jgi:DNA-directed RNA polymerase